MSDRTYWPRVAAQRAQLDKQFPSGSTHIAAVVNGRVCSASNEVGAVHIVNGSHRIAGPEEVSEFQRQQELAATASRPVNGLESARRMFAALQPGTRDKQ